MYTVIFEEFVHLTLDKLNIEIIWVIWVWELFSKYFVGVFLKSCSEYYTSMSVSGLPTFLISAKNMNLLSSSIYKHLKTYLIKHKQSLILGECGSQLIVLYKKKKNLTGYIQYYKKMVGQTQSPWVRQNPSSCLTQCQTGKKFSPTL
jgi:hypothetical protein